MLIRATLSPLMRVAMTGANLPTVSFRPSTTFPARSLLLKNSHVRSRAPVMIPAALLTTQTNGSSSHTAALSLRSLSRRQKPVTPFPPSLLHNRLGAIAVFSSGPPRGGGNRMGMAGGLLGAGALLLGKGKYVLGALKLTKLSSLASMAVSVGAYSMFFGFPYAVGMVGLIIVHESGHALAMRSYGMPFSPMVFLPFMGAVIATKSHPRDAWQDAAIGIAGPVTGTAGAMAVAIGAQVTDSQLLYALADFGYMINLFNMLPLGSMDGGRITGALSPYAGVVGLAGGAGMIYSGLIHNPLFYIIMLAGGWETFQRFYNPAGHRPPGFYKITPMQRGILGGAYFGLIGTLLVAMSANAVSKKTPEQLERYQELHFDEREF